MLYDSSSALKFHLPNKLFTLPLNLTSKYQSIEDTPRYFTMVKQDWLLLQFQMNFFYHKPQHHSLYYLHFHPSSHILRPHHVSCLMFAFSIQVSLAHPCKWDTNKFCKLPRLADTKKHQKTCSQCQHSVEQLTVTIMNN